MNCVTSKNIKNKENNDVRLNSNHTFLCYLIVRRFFIFNYMVIDEKIDRFQM